MTALVFNKLVRGHISDIMVHMLASRW